MGEKEKSSELIHGHLNYQSLMAEVRTVLANRRTLLAYLRTGLALVISGFAMIRFFGHPWVEIVGALLVCAGVVSWVLGSQNYFRMKRLISASSQEAEAESHEARRPPSGNVPL